MIGNGFDRLAAYQWQLAVGSSTSGAKCRIHNATRFDCLLPWVASSLQGNDVVLHVWLYDVYSVAEDGFLSNAFAGVVYPHTPTSAAYMAAARRVRACAVQWSQLETTRIAAQGWQ